MRMSTSLVQYGQRRVEVSPEVFEAWLVNEKRVKTDLPEDARLLAVWPPKTGDERGTVTLLFESGEWDELSEAERIPKITPMIEEADD